MFWSKKPTSDIKDDDGNHLSKENVSDNANGTGEIQNIINEMIDEDKRRANTLRERAGSRAEALELSKFPVCDYDKLKNIFTSYFFFE